MTSKSPFKWRHFAPDIIFWGVRAFLPLSSQLPHLGRNDVRAGGRSRSHYAVSLGAKVRTLIWTSSAVRP